MLDFIPFARPRGKMANSYRYSNFVRQLLQKEFPASVTASVAPSSIGANKQIFAV
jgi:hypothetical protein